MDQRSFSHQGSNKPTVWDRPLFQKNLQNNNIDLPVFNFFPEEACMYASLPLSPSDAISNQI